MHRLAIPALAALAACNPTPEETGAPALPPPGALQAGFATLPIPAPVGIGTAGYGPFDAPESVSPFADVFPATTRVHGLPEIRAAVISRGEGYEVVFVRLDTVGVFQQIRRAVVLELEARLGRDMDHVLVLGGSHTHSGPGRVIDGGGIFDYLADRFHPEFYARFVDAMADAVEAAYADLAPARLGVGLASSPDAHSDRRCEDGLDHENGAIPLLAVERDGVLDGLVMAYAVHGTILGLGALTLSRDSIGGIQEAVEERFDHPVSVLCFDSWGGDMSPGSPEVPEAAVWAERPSGHDRMEQVGAAVAGAVESALDGLAWSETPEIGLRTYRTRIDREVLGYSSGEFPYAYGGVYCSGDSDCDPATTVEDLDQACVPFNETYPAPTQTEFTVGRVGDMHLVTFTGEPGTVLAEQVVAGLQAHEDVGDVMFLGYTQDYLGYSILEDDWWQGGYEASGALWGPLQGAYLADFVVDAFDAWKAGQDLPDQPPPVDAFGDPEFTPYTPATAVGAGTVLEDVPAEAGPTDTVTVVVAGADPWLGTPRATLETAGGEAVLRGGRPVTSDGHRFHVDLEVAPPWSESATERTFRWSFHMPVQRRYDPEGGLEAGPYRLRVEVPGAEGEAPLEVTSGTFQVGG